MIEGAATYQKFSASQWNQSFADIALLPSMEKRVDYQSKTTSPLRQYFVPRVRPSKRKTILPTIHIARVTQSNVDITPSTQRGHLTDESTAAPGI